MLLLCVVVVCVHYVEKTFEKQESHKEDHISTSKKTKYNNAFLSEKCGVVTETERQEMMMWWLLGEIL